MKTVELPGLIARDISSLWRDLLKKDFDVEGVGVSSKSTFIYVADDEQKDVQPIVEIWAGKDPAQMGGSATESRSKEISELLENAKKRRIERAALLAQEEAERRLMGLPTLQVSATGQPGILGIVEALSNGIDSHTVLIQKVDPDNKIMEGDEELSVTTSHKVPISNPSPKLDGGMAMIQVGPSNAVGDLVLEVKDCSGGMKTAKLTLRFVKQRTEQPSGPAPALEKNGGIMSVVRKLLGI